MIDSGDKLIERADGIGDRFAARSKRMFWTSLFVKIVLISGGGITVGISQFLAAGNSPLTLWNIVGIIGASITGLGGLFLIITDEDASKDLEYARSAVADAQELERVFDELEVYEEKLTRSTHLYQAMSSMSGAIDRSMATPDGRTVVQLIEALLTIAERSIRIALNYQTTEHWTLCVYKAERDEKSGKTFLKCIAADRSVKCALGDAREWPEGVGIPGATYSKAGEIIVPDLFAHGSVSLFGTGERVPKKPSDQEHYRSAAGMPITLEPTSEPWGVVVATSNHPGHFKNDAGSGVNRVEAVRALALMLGLAVRAKLSEPTTPGKPA